MASQSLPAWGRICWQKAPLTSCSGSSNPPHRLMSDTPKRRAVEPYSGTTKELSVPSRLEPDSEPTFRRQLSAVSQRNTTTPGPL